VIDIEGNGQHPPDLIELGLLPITGGQPGEPAAWLFRPEAPITPIARRIHGITNDATAAAPVFTEHEAEVRACLAEAVLVAHNASVDLGVLKRKTARHWPACTPLTVTTSTAVLDGRADAGKYRLRRTG
jgi:exodeoxyribonuclease X